MPSSTMREESEYKLPADTPLPAILVSVEEREIKYKRDGKDKKFVKWEWEFEITEGEYAGLHAYGESENYLSTHPDNKVRQWGEVLRDQPFEVGEGIDTDLLLGLPCVLTIRHDPPRPKKDGSNFYPCPVDQVFPEGTNVIGAGQEESPPF